MDFFGVLPDYSVRLIELSDRVDPEMEDIFRRDIEEYRRRESKPFYPDYKPENDEKLGLDSYELPPVMERGMLRWQSREKLTPGDIRPHEVKAIVAVEYGTRPAGAPEDRQERFVRLAAFKRIDKSRIIDRSVLRIVWDGNTFNRIDGPGVTVADGLDALYEDGGLSFTSHRNANGFLDLAGAFDEASRPQIDEIMDAGILVFAGEGDIHEFVNSTCKRSMSMLWRSGRLTSVKVADVERHAEAYGVDMSCDGEGVDRRILVPETNKGFKALLDLLNQNYFPGIFDGEKYVANSKRPI